MRIRISKSLVTWLLMCLLCSIIVCQLKLQARVPISMITNPTLSIINEQVSTFINGCNAHKQEESRNLLYKNTSDFKHIVTIQIRVNLQENDYIYADYITLSSDSPHVILSPWQSTIDPISRYDVTFKRTKKIFVQPFTLTLTAEIISIEHMLPQSAHIHFTYYAQSNNGIRHEIVALISIPKDVNSKKHLFATLSSDLDMQIQNHSNSRSRIVPKTLLISQERKSPLLFSWIHTLHALLRLFYAWLILLICILSTFIYTRWWHISFFAYTKILWFILAIVCACIIYTFIVAF